MRHKLETGILFLASGFPRTILIVSVTAFSIYYSKTDFSATSMYYRGAAGLVAGFFSVGMMSHIWSFCCVCMGYAAAGVWPVWLRKKQNPGLNVLPEIQTALMAVGDVSHGLLVVGPILAGWCIGLFFRARFFPEVV